MEARIMDNVVMNTAAMQSAIKIAEEYTSRNETVPLKKRITQNDVAEAVGVTRACVATILNPKEDAIIKSGLNIPEHTIARVRKVAKEMGYKTKAERVKAEDVAKELGRSVNSVVYALSRMEHESLSLKTFNMIRAYASLMGYEIRERRDNANKRSEAIKPKRYWGGNFATHKEELARMNELREEGYANAEIAKKIGRSTACVLYNIGAQPKEITEMRRALAKKKIRQTNSGHKAAAIAVREAKNRAEIEAKILAYRNSKQEAETKAAELTRMFEALEAERVRRAEEAAQWNVQYRTAMAEIEQARMENESNIVKLSELRSQMEEEAEKFSLAI